MALNSKSEQNSQAEQKSAFDETSSSAHALADKPADKPKISKPAEENPETTEELKPTQETKPITPANEKTEPKTQAAAAAKKQNAAAEKNAPIQAVSPIANKAKTSASMPSASRSAALPGASTAETLKSQTPVPLKSATEKNIPQKILKEKILNFLKNNLSIARQKRKKIQRENLQKILNSFSRQDKITNNKVEKLLRIPDRTASWYLNLLFKQGKIMRFGKNPNIYYQKYDI